MQHGHQHVQQTRQHNVLHALQFICALADKLELLRCVMWQQQQVNSCSVPCPDRQHGPQ